MTRRIRGTVAGVAALMALGFGGAVFAQAQSGSERVGGPDRDSIEQGDQTTPDVANVSASTKKAKAHHPRHHVRRHATRAASSSQQSGAGDQSGASEQPGVENPEQPGLENSEQSGESANGSDGPGGHADEAGGGNANADHQFQGEE